MRPMYKLLLSIVVMIVFLVLAFAGINFSEVARAAGDVRVEWILAVVVLLILSDYFRALRWRYFLSPIKPNVTTSHLFSGVMIGYLLNNLLPRAGEVAKSIGLARMESIPTSAVLGTTVIERFLDLLTLLVLVSVLPLMYIGPLNERLPWLADAQLVGMIFGFALMAGVGLLSFRGQLALKVIEQISLVMPSRSRARFRSLFVSFFDGFSFFRQPIKLVPVLLFTALIWSAYVCMTYAGIQAFNLDHLLRWRASVIILTIGTIGVAIPTPGATGSYHFCVSTALSGLYGISPETALSFATINHAAIFLGTTVVGLFFLAKEHITVKDIFNRGGTRDSRDLPNGRARPSSKSSSFVGDVDRDENR